MVGDGGENRQHICPTVRRRGRESFLASGPKKVKLRSLRLCLAVGTGLIEHREERAVESLGIFLLSVGRVQFILQCISVYRNQSDD